MGKNAAIPHILSQISGLRLVISHIGPLIPHAIRRDLEPPGQVVETTEGKYDDAHSDSCLDSADGLGTERPTQVDEAVNSHGARQVDCVQLKGREDGAEEAYVAIEETLVHVDFQADFFVGDARLVGFVREQIAK